MERVRGLEWKSGSRVSKMEAQEPPKWGPGPPKWRLNGAGGVRIEVWRTQVTPKLALGQLGWRFGGPRDRQDGHLGAPGGGLGALLGSLGGVWGSFLVGFWGPKPVQKGIFWDSNWK